MTSVEDLTAENASTSFQLTDLFVEMEHDPIPKNYDKI